jgi:hypothetical protein
MDGKPVVFSEGNLLSNQSSLAGLPAETQHGLIALLRFRVGDGEVRVDRVDYVPTTVRLSDYVALPVGRALVEGSGDEAELRAAYVSTVGIAGRGQGIAPLPRRLP